MLSSVRIKIGANKRGGSSRPGVLGPDSPLSVTDLRSSPQKMCSASNEPASGLCTSLRHVSHVCLQVCEGQFENQFEHQFDGHLKHRVRARFNVRLIQWFEGQFDSHMRVDLEVDLRSIKIDLEVDVTSTQSRFGCRFGDQGRDYRVVWGFRLWEDHSSAAFGRGSARRAGSCDPGRYSFIR